MRKILGIFKVFLGVFEKTKEKKDRAGKHASRFSKLALAFQAPTFAGQNTGWPRFGCGSGMVPVFGSDFRWAKSRESYRRIASESYRSDSNH